MYELEREAHDKMVEKLVEKEEEKMREEKTKKDYPKF